MKYLIMVLPMLLLACGQPKPDPPTNSIPIPIFSSVSTIAAGEPLVLDGTTSTDADGDSLMFSWDLGDGSKAGTAKLAHVFAKGGTFTVQLAVSDGKSMALTQKIVTVTEPPAPTKTVTVLGVVKDNLEQPLEGVKLEIVNASNSAISNTNGQATLNAVGAGNNSSVTVKISKTGYAEQFKVLELPQAAESGYFEIIMQPRADPLTLSDAGAGGSLTGTDGAKLELPANALIDSSGNAVTGAIQVNLTPVDVDKNIAAFPGRFEGTGTDGQQGLIMSYGTAEFVLSQNGSEVNLAAGKQATIEIPVYTTLNKDGSSVNIGSVYPLWSLNEQTGTWTQEGTGTVVTSSSSPSGMALRGNVAHFSWWNHDDFAGPSYKPKPKCLVDTNADGILEDLTGTGHCWHAGTGPEQPDDGFGTTNLRPQAVDPRIPAFMAEDTTPAAGGKILEMPADVNVLVRSSAKNGELAGQTIFRGPANLEEDVIVVLKPVQTGTQDTPITTPWDVAYNISAIGEKDRFRFTAIADQFYRIQVARNGSSLDGVVKLFKNGVQVQQKTFALALATIELIAEAGEYTIEISSPGSGSNAIGGYNLSVIEPNPSNAPLFQSLQNNTGTFCSNKGSNSLYFRGQIGQTIALRLVVGTNTSPYSGTFKLFKSVSDTTLTSRIFGNSQTDTSEGAMIIFTPSETTIYRVESTWKGICKVSLTVNAVSEIVVNTNTNLGTITNAQETRVYRFAGTSNWLVSAGALADAQNNNRPKLAIELFDSNNTRLATNYREPSSTNPIIQRILEPTVLPSTGNYYIVVRPLPCFQTCSPAATNVQLGLSQLEPTPAPTALSAETINILGNIKYYSLNLTQGEIVRVKPLSSTEGTFLQYNVYIPSNAVFYERPKLFSTDKNNPFNIIAPSTGEYILEIRGMLVSNPEGFIRTGTFNLEIVRPVAKTLELGIADTISLGAYGIVIYNLSIPSAGNYSFSSPINPSIDEYALLDASGNRTNITNTPSTTLNLSAGTYKLFFSNGSNNFRSFTFSVNSLP